MRDDTNSIQFKKREHLDDGKWNECIRSSDNGLIYANTNMLDALCPGWNGLILGNYDAVMPLTGKRKFGFDYLYQPPFIASLGVMGKISKPEIVADFISAIPENFRLIDMPINEKNELSRELAIPGMKIRMRTNLILPLDDYNQVVSGYKRLGRRMIAKAKELNLKIKTGLEPAEVITFYKKYYSKSHSLISDSDYSRLQTACNSPFGIEHVTTYLAYAPDGEMLAAYLLFKDEKYLYSILGGSNEKGKENGAFYYLTDCAIRDHCWQNKTFRFEGSDKKGIAFFDSQFGATVIQYPHLYLNKLPWPIRWLKK